MNDRFSVSETFNSAQQKAHAEFGAHSEIDLLPDNYYCCITKFTHAVGQRIAAVH
jgi:hypothetical protein